MGKTKRYRSNYRLTNDKIKDTVIELIKEKGDTTVREVAERAGVSISTAYDHRCPDMILEMVGMEYERVKEGENTMKLTIKSGVSTAKAMMYIENFLDDNYKDYAFLKGNLNLYITLKDDENRNCPDNEKEYVLAAENTTDVEAEKIAAAKRKVLSSWKKHIEYHKRMLEKKIKEVSIDENYLATAKDKGRKPENIEKRQRLYQKNQIELRKMNETNDLLEKLDQCVNSRKMEWYITKWKGRRKTSYDYSFEVYLLFRNIGGFTGYYEESPYHNGRTGVLRKGLPGTH